MTATMKWNGPCGANGDISRLPKYYHDPDGSKARAREARITELMEEAGAEGADPGREYWELVYDNEEAPYTTDMKQLCATGFTLPAPGDLDDAALTTRLWELIRELARMHVYLSFTDHLSDRQLYELLYEEALHEERRDVPMAPGDAWHLDMTWVGMQHPVCRLDADADDEAFEAALATPGRYDRDRHLPVPDYGGR